MSTSSFSQAESAPRSWCSRLRRSREKLFRLALKKAASRRNCLAMQASHATRVMKFFDSGAALAQDMGVSVSKVKVSKEAQSQVSLKELPKILMVGRYPPYSFGKSWGEG